MRNRLLQCLNIIILGNFLSGCGLLEWKDRAIDALVSRIPSELEASLGQEILPSVLPADMIIRDSELQMRLERLLGPLIKATGATQAGVRIYISRESDLNAFALPGGILIFNAGMLLAAESPEEILGVSAHEMAHVTERHVVKSMIQSLSLAAIVSYFLGDVTELGAYILRQSQLLLQNGFTRTQEARADQIGFDYLVAAGINPEGMNQFFKRLEKRKSEDGESRTENRSLQRVHTFLSTHPLTEERIRMVDERMASLSSEQKRKLKAVSFDLKAFQKLLHQNQ